MISKKHNTSWGQFAQWYNELLSGAGTYQKELILPNLLRLMAIRPGEKIADIACGQGFFSAEFHRAGATVTGVDIAKELIEIARKNAPENIRFLVSPSTSLQGIGDETIDKATLILAVQNIEQVNATLAECRRILKKNGRLYIVLNHPAFRVPKGSDWGWDEEKKVQYRRIDTYLSESKEKIQMHPGEDATATTITFHRPLQFYFKALRKNGFAVTALEEWNSHKKSQSGPRQKAEDTARREIPLFLFLEAKK